MKIAVACDHGGLRLKNVLIDEMKKQGYEVVDYGTYTEDSCDYLIMHLRQLKLLHQENVRKVSLFVEQASVYQLHVIR